MMNNQINLSKILAICTCLENYRFINKIKINAINEHFIRFEVFLI